MGKKRVVSQLKSRSTDVADHELSLSFSGRGKTISDELSALKPFALHTLTPVEETLDRVIRSHKQESTRSLHPISSSPIKESALFNSGHRIGEKEALKLQEKFSRIVQKPKRMLFNRRVGGASSIKKSKTE